MADVLARCENAFLYDDLDEVSMKQPLGMLLRWRIWCKIKKAIYGLKQSLQVLSEKSSRVVNEGGFQQCHSDHLVFICHNLAGSVILAVYVDEILLIGNDLSLIHI